MHPEIFDYIPQRPPMVMIDKLTHCDDKKTCTSFLIKPENIFCENGFFQAPGLIENIAQTAAARDGFAVQKLDRTPRIGFIAAIKELNIIFLPEVNTEICSEVTIETEIMGFTLMHGKVFSNQKLAAECEMRIFIQQ